MRLSGPYYECSYSTSEKIKLYRFGLDSSCVLLYVSNDQRQTPEWQWPRKGTQTDESPQSQKSITDSTHAHTCPSSFMYIGTSQGIESRGSFPMSDNGQ